MKDQESNWDIVECPDCKTKKVTMIAVDAMKHKLTFKCKTCKKEFQQNA